MPTSVAQLLHRVSAIFSWMPCPHVSGPGANGRYLHEHTRDVKPGRSVRSGHTGCHKRLSLCQVQHQVQTPHKHADFVRLVQEASALQGSMRVRAASLVLDVQLGLLFNAAAPVLELEPGLVLACGAVPLSNVDAHRHHVVMWFGHRCSG